jgi:nitrogen fixation protein FixH
MFAASQSGGGAKRPRQVTGRSVLIGLIVFFAVVAGVNAVMIGAAVSTFGGVETESSYKAGLAFAREMTAAQAQDQRHWQVHATIVRIEHGQRIEIRAQDAGDHALADVEATVQLAHPTDRRADRSVALTALSAGRFSGATDAPEGQWDLVIELVRDGDRLFRSKSRVRLR